MATKGRGIKFSRYRDNPLPDPTDCIVCGKTALYRSKGDGFCKEHYSQAQTLTLARDKLFRIRIRNSNDEQAMWTFRRLL